jgi:hypothetical protein
VLLYAPAFLEVLEPLLWHHIGHCADNRSRIDEVPPARLTELVELLVGERLPAVCAEVTREGLDVYPCLLGTLVGIVLST